jgi:hypothetical protein
MSTIVGHGGGGHSTACIIDLVKYVVGIYHHIAVPPITHHPYLGAENRDRAGPLRARVKSSAARVVSEIPIMQVLIRLRKQTRAPMLLVCGRFSNFSRPI